jgi:hypothetical protein
MALGALAGWRRGFITPSVAAIGALAGLYALYTGPASGAVPTGTAGLGVGVVVVFLIGSVLAKVGWTVASVIHRVGVLHRADKVLGIPLGAVTALVGIYAGLVVVVSFDDLLGPVNGAPTVNAAAVASVKAGLTANPQFGVLLDPGTVDQLASAVATSAVPQDQLGNVSKALSLYETDVRPSLLQSILAPLILSTGERVPLIGRHVDFPTK